MSYLLNYKKIISEKFVIADRNYFPIQFSPSDSPYAYLHWADETDLDSQICEMHYNGNEWELFRIRHDKRDELATGTSFGNSFHVAELIWRNYSNPLTFQDLVNPSPSNNYFQVSDSQEHRALRSFVSYVKGKLLGTHRGSEWVLDMAGGKGQDLFRYADKKISNVLFLEIEKDAIGELVSRKLAFSKLKSGNKMAIHALQMDLNAPYRKNLDRLKCSGINIPNGFPVIVCNLAMHYFVKDSSAIKNIALLVKSLLADKGRFYFTAFDGRTVFNLLKSQFENHAKWEWTVSTPSSIKYSIKKAFASNTFTRAGQKIEVVLPFSDGKYYEEYLVNNTTVEKTFAKAGLRREVFDSFSRYLPMFKKDNPNMYHQLDENDKTWASLYHYAGFFKPG